MAITLTEAAARHVSSYLERRGKGIGLRLGVKTTGCSGLAYKLEYAVKLLRDKVGKLREMSPLWEMVKDGIDLNTVQWAAH